MIKFVFAIFLSGLLFAQSVHTKDDVRICENKFNLSESLKLSDKPIDEVMTEIAKSFIGIDYAANTLQNEKQEELRIHLSGLDCYTFIEASLVFSRLIKKGSGNFSNFESEIENIRYRNGKLDGYPSRLHYFSDWLFDMENRGVINLVTEKIGGEVYKNNVNFMSTHPQYYKELKNNTDFINTMCCIEKKISSRKYFYIPQEKIELSESNINSGDIIGITTNINGLDISHVGIAIKMENNRIHLLHAPTIGKKIQITEIPLADYIKKNKKQTGIMVGRVLEIK